MSFVHRVDELVEDEGNALVGKAAHWERIPLGKIASVINGFPFPSKGFNNESRGEPVIRIRDILSGTVGTFFKGNVEGAPRLDHGELVIGMDGDFNCRLWPGESVLMNQRVCKVVADETIYSTQFLSYALPGYLKLINDHTSAITVKHLSSGTVQEIPLPLPPRPEQDRLVSRLDELFSRIDEGERALERVSRLVERYRQSVLKAAVTGELTRDWREKHKGKVESGEALLTRILTARRKAWEQAELAKMRAKGITPKDEKWKQKYKEPSLLDTTDLLELPEEWVWANVEQLCFVDTGATPKRGTSKYYENGTVPWVTSSAVNERLILKAAELITPAAIDETNAKVFPAGSLLVALYGEGKTRGKISELGIDAATNQACAALLCGHLGANVKSYIRAFFEKNYEALRLEAAGGVQPNLNLSILKLTQIPIPPSNEMDQINQMLSELHSQLAAIVSEFSICGRQSVALRQAVLRSAFRGELVSQKTDDEPASVLLERIATERAMNIAAPKRGRKKKITA